MFFSAEYKEMEAQMNQLKKALEAKEKALQDAKSDRNVLPPIYAQYFFSDWRAKA